MRVIFFLMIGMGTFLSADLIVNGESNQDKVLEWQDNNDTLVVRTWQESIDYCEALTLASHDDWRVPNINELKTLIDRSKSSPSTVDGLNHIGSANNFGYWSSTALSGKENFAWHVLFSYGYVYHISKKSTNHVRCVRNKK